MNYRDIQFRMEDGIGMITLNRPEKRNALSTNLMAEMIHLLGAIKANPEIRVLIIKAEGKVFSSGHDLSPEMEGEIINPKGSSLPARKNFILLSLS